MGSINYAQSLYFDEDGWKAFNAVREFLNVVENNVFDGVNRSFSHYNTDFYVFIQAFAKLREEAPQFASAFKGPAIDLAVEFLALNIAPLLADDSALAGFKDDFTDDTSVEVYRRFLEAGGHSTFETAKAAETHRKIGFFRYGFQDSKRHVTCYPDGFGAHSALYLSVHVEYENAADGRARKALLTLVDSVAQEVREALVELRPFEACRDIINKLPPLIADTFIVEFFA